MLTVRLACSQFRTLKLEKVSQSRLWQQSHTNLYNHTSIHLKQTDTIQAILYKQYRSFDIIRPP